MSEISGASRLNPVYGAPARRPIDEVVVLSGGMDSAVCLALAAQESARLLAVSFRYGQRHARELVAAKALADRYGAEHLVVEFNARAWGGSALTDGIAVPVGGSEATSGIPATYVPARNMIFISVALSVAEARGAHSVWLGVNAVDYSGYPDCRPEFIAAMQRAAEAGQKCGVEGAAIAIKTPLIGLTKAGIVRRGLELGVPFDLTWSCYIGGESPCCGCDSCRLRARGFAEAGASDPLLEQS